MEVWGVCFMGITIGGGNQLTEFVICVKNPSYMCEGILR